MRALIQRVGEATVGIAGAITARIGPGLLVLAAVTSDDAEDDHEWLARKIVQMRIFDDASGVMNQSVLEVGGEILAVSQFTLYASTRKGNRPSWSAAAPPDIAQPHFDRFVRALSAELGRAVPTGVFGAHMQVALVNDGPVTLWLDSRARE